MKHVEVKMTESGPRNTPEDPLIAEITARNRLTFDVDDTVKRFIGHAIVKFSAMEAIATELIWELANLSFEDGRTITKNMGVRQKIDLAKGFCAEYKLDIPNPSFGEKNVWNSIYEMIEERNIIAHSVWVTHDNRIPLCISTKEKTDEKNHIHAEVFDLDRLNNLSAKCIEVTEILHRSLGSVKRQHPKYRMRPS